MVTVYTTQTCAYCPLVKKYLEAKGVEYEAVDVTEDKDKREELLSLTGMMSVPVTTKDKNFVVGFKPGELAKLIA